MDLSIVIPIYNSSSIIRESVNRLTLALNRMGVDYEIVFRDDGSTDQSRDILRTIPSENSNIRVFFNPQNLGLGATLRQMFESARGKYVIYTDCDLPFGEDIYAALYSRVINCDVAVASRYKDIVNPIRFTRMAASRLYYLLCKVLFGIPVVDIGSGAVAFKKEALNKLNLSSDGFEVHAEIFVKAKQLGLDICEFPAKLQGGYEGSFSVVKHGFGILKNTLKLRVNGMRWE